MIHEQDTARKIIDVLEYGSAQLETNTVEQLATARSRAVRRVAASAYGRHTEAATPGAGRLIVDYVNGRWARGVALLVLAALLALIALHQTSPLSPVEGDVLLLASELPPEAYVDKGFDAWLEHSSQL